jgi:hypothetical protein
MRRFPMLYAIALAMIALWLLAEFTSYIKGDMIHVLLVIALVAIVLRIMRRQNVWVALEPPSADGRNSDTHHHHSLRPGRRR